MRSWWPALAVIGLAALLGSCGGSGQPALNPTPSISALFPADITAGSALFTLNLTGTGFVQNVTQAFWNGSQRPATLNTSTGQLAVSILASDVAVAGNGQVLVVNPPPGGGPAFSPATFVINPTQNGAPVITGFSPVDTPANTKLPFTLTVNGANFVATVGPTLGSTIEWNGTLRNTTFVNATTLTTTDFSAADLATCGSASITVDNPGVNGGIVHSVSVDFNVTGTCNPVPSIVSVSPPSTMAGKLPPGDTLTINGFDFMSSGMVFFNGTERNPAIMSDTQITVPITVTDVSAAGTIAITVSNPAPGGGISAAGIFTITP